MLGPDVVDAALAELYPTDPGSGPLAAYYDDPAGFARDLIVWPPGQNLTDYQGDCLDGIVTHRRVAVRGPHGLGKTGTASLAILWFALTRDAAGRDWKIPITASAWMQLTRYLWPEVHKWAGRLRWDRIGRGPFSERELLDLTLKLRHGEAFSASPSDAARIEGAHATEILYVYDEAKTIPADVFDATEGAFANAGPDTDSNAYALAVSTPGEPQGRFYEINRRQAGTEDWHVRPVSKGEAIAAGRMSADWADQRARQWGPGSAVYQNRVEGEFASSDEDGVIPLAWVEAAQQRWHDHVDQLGVVPSDGSPDAVGVDCSGSGSDRTVLARRFGDWLAPLERPRKAASVETGDEEMATAGRVTGILQAHPGCRAVVDGIGLGAGVVGRVREQTGRSRVTAFIASEGTKRKDRTGEFGFVNVRSAAWWAMREALDPDAGATLCLPPDDELVGDLTAPHWLMQSGGRVKIESKDEIRKRLGRSTDAADAVIQACWRDGGPVSSGTAARMVLPRVGLRGR